MTTTTNATTTHADNVTHITECWQCTNHRRMRIRIAGVWVLIEPYDRNKLAAKVEMDYDTCDECRDHEVL